MQKIHPILCVTLAVILSLTALAACENNKQKQRESTIRYTSFLDIPGVTQAEIDAITALREQRDHFVYGIVRSTEAFHNNNNEVRGYSALVSEWLTELFGIPFKPKLYAWDELLKGMRSGEIDFSGDLTATAERRKTYHMTDPISKRTVKVFRLAGSPPLHKIANSRPLKYIFLSGTTTIADVASVMRDRYDSVFVPSIEYVYKKLKNGEADAFINEELAEAVFDAYDDVIVENFLPLIFSPASLSTRNPSLEPVISVVQKALESGGRRHLTKMYALGYREYLKHKLFLRLTGEEREYLTKHPQVLFAAEHENYPMSFYNRREKEWQGLAFDVLGELEKLTGISFKLANQPGVDWLELLHMLDKGQVSLITELIRTPKREGGYLWPDTILLPNRYALISRSDFPDITVNEILDVTIGLQENTAYAQVFERWFPGHGHTVMYTTSEAAFSALARGEVDMVMSSEKRLLALTHYQELPGYKVNMVFNYHIDSTFGFNINEAPLRSIVDKALPMIDLHKIEGRWARKTYDYRVKLAQERLPLLIGATALLFMLIISIILFYKKRHQSGQLERLVQVRTADLETASRAKSDFLSNMSHEMRTPLNAILGMTSIGRATQDVERKDYALRNIENASANLLRIINDVLDMAKIEANKLELSHVEYNIERMLKSVIPIVKCRTDEKKQKLGVHIDVKVPHFVIGDDQHLSQVITNLLANASKFTPEYGEICLSVSLEQEENDICTLRFEVADNGIGISPEQQKQLFQAFSQAESGISRAFGGTGLGLALSKRIVEMMGGKIWTESELGQGSRFIFTIQARRGKQHLLSLFSPGIKREDLHVMIVDDDVSIREYFITVLDHVNITCSGAGSAAEALRMIEANGDYDIYFIDQIMEDTNGIELTKRIKQREKGKNAIVTLISSYWPLMKGDELRAAGVDKYVEKPVFASTIIERINECLDIESARQEEAFQKTTRGQFAGKRLLLVEDVEINREIVVALLSDTGVDIDEAENGQEALAMVEANPGRYDLVFMDLQMPKMDGLEATRNIRALPSEQAQKLPIVAMTANAFKEDIENCRAAGMNAHLGKPLELDKVLTAMRKYLSG